VSIKEIEGGLKMNSKWNEVQLGCYDENEGYYEIYGWKISETDYADVIAHVYYDNIKYFNADAQDDEYVQSVIEQAQRILQ
jgi:hypothetical protein